MQGTAICGSCNPAEAVNLPAEPDVIQIEMCVGDNKMVLAVS
jgi:hypothetical protein